MVWLKVVRETKKAFGKHGQDTEREIYNGREKLKTRLDLSIKPKHWK